jgi:hypothetical protein
MRRFVARLWIQLVFLARLGLMLRGLRSLRLFELALVSTSMTVSTRACRNALCCTLL